MVYLKLFNYKSGAVFAVNLRHISSVDLDLEIKRIAVANAD